MRKIKFRGRRIYGGEIVYGSLVIYSDGRYRHWIHPPSGERNYPVEPESIAQLVGYDRDGKEVYEGDYLRLIDDGKIYDYKASLIGQAWTDDGKCCIGEKMFDKRELITEAKHAQD